MRIHWSEKYNTGLPLVDAEHHILVMLFKKLDVAIKTKQSDRTITRIVAEVRRFVDFHFYSEESIMLETAYPHFEQHQKIHTELLIELNAKISKVVSHREYPDDLLDFLSRWLFEHIGKHDQGIAEHIKKTGKHPFAEEYYLEFLKL